MPFKTPPPHMAGFITIVLLTLFAFSYIAPVLEVSWIKSNAQFDQALQQNLLLLLVLAVGYYIGTTKSADDKSETIATQAATAATLASAVPPAPPAPPSQP